MNACGFAAIAAVGSCLRAAKLIEIGEFKAYTPLVARMALAKSAMAANFV
jgi:hypothetical protein